MVLGDFFDSWFVHTHFHFCILIDFGLAVNIAWWINFYLFADISYVWVWDILRFNIIESLLGLFKSIFSI